MEEKSQASAWLTASSGQQTSIRGTCLLGRAANNTIVLPGDKVSRRHSMVHAQGQDEYWLVDLGSSNGTYLNGRRVSQPCQLSDGDQITIAEHRFTFAHPRTKGPSAADRSGAEKTIQEIRSLNCWLLLADIESSTQFTKRLPAEEAPRVTGRWLAACKQIVDDNHGAINKFLGDGFFAYWVEREDSAAAVARAVTQLKAMQQTADPRFRLVLHHGKVFVGGEASMGEESLLGNEVNFVFRMEKLAGSIGEPALLSEAANSQIKEFLPTAEEGSHPVSSFDGTFLFFRV